MYGKIIDNDDELIEFSPPRGYDFEHPCGNIYRNEETFFYNPKNPRRTAVIVKNLSNCKSCTCHFLRGLDLKHMCQGIEIKTELEVDIITINGERRLIKRV